MQIWNMKMKMAVIKVIYEAPQSHLWRRHDSLVSFMCGRPSSRWQASLPSGPPFSPSLCRGGLRWLIAPTTYTQLFVHTWFILLIKMCDQSPLLAATDTDAPTLNNFQGCCPPSPHHSHTLRQHQPPPFESLRPCKIWHLEELAQKKQHPFGLIENKISSRLLLRPNNQRPHSSCLTEYNWKPSKLTESNWLKNMWSVSEKKTCQVLNFW